MGLRFSFLKNSHDLFILSTSFSISQWHIADFLFTVKKKNPTTAVLLEEVDQNVVHLEDGSGNKEIGSSLK